MNSNNISPRPCGKLCLFLFILFGCGLFVGPKSIAQTRDWQPRRTWVFVVGTLQWKHRDMFDSFPKENRRDAQLVEFFKHQGVPAEQMVYLQDAQATTRQVKTAFPAFLAKAQEVGRWTHHVLCHLRCRRKCSRVVNGFDRQRCRKVLQRIQGFSHGGLLLFGQPGTASPAPGPKSIVRLLDLLVRQPTLYW